MNFAKFLKKPFLHNTPAGCSCKLNSEFEIMQSDLVVTKKVDLELSSRLVNMECQCLANVQSSKREY